MVSFWLMLTAIVAVAIIAGAIASVVGFGIGSLLTPILALQTGTRLAVACVSIPHLVGTAVRFWLLRRHVDHRLLWGFGLMSAAGGFAGALLQSIARNPVLTAVFGGLLVFVGVSELTGLARRMRFSGPVAWLAGGLSGFLGGLVGNQGGIRSAAMLGFDVRKEAFVATATAVGVMVDLGRVPVYLITQGPGLLKFWPFLMAATAGVLIGTFAGERLLHIVPERAFRPIVAVLVLGIGLAILGSVLNEATET